MKKIYEAEAICFSSGSEINKHLKIAIQTTKSKVGTVEETLTEDIGAISQLGKVIDNIVNIFYTYESTVGAIKRIKRL